jgi:hypothetical protein
MSSLAKRIDEGGGWLRGGWNHHPVTREEKMKVEGI